jgi:50S ribosomal protein L16 3-hydroxylase
MLQQLVTLEIMPSPTDFYSLYWNRRPFIVRGVIPQSDLIGLISADELAGLALEEAPQSRLVRTAGDLKDWSCQFGPFSKDDFKDAGEEGWVLLVQNIEQFHPQTAKLLRHFNFSPRWLMDDVMASYSTPGGTVGPHIDSYHVFLVQGQGTRRWKVGCEAIENEVYVEGLDLKIFADEYVGDQVEVKSGDVLYLPPKFAHESTTLENSLTFSVGFLGPKLSELFGGYGQYLSELEERDQRYVGQGLMVDSAGFTISGDAVDHFRAHLGEQLSTIDFTQWLGTFFSGSSHEDFGNYSEREVLLDEECLQKKLNEGSSLLKPEYVKFAIMTTNSESFQLGFDNKNFTFHEGLLPVFREFMKEEVVNLKNTPGLFSNPATLELLLDLYNHQALELT